MPPAGRQARRQARLAGQRRSRESPGLASTFSTTTNAAGGLSRIVAVVELWGSAAASTAALQDGEGVGRGAEGYF